MEKMNLVCLTGNLTKDIVLEKVGKDQTSKASFTLAVSRDYKNSKGEYETDFPKVTVWRNSADYLAKYAGKGTMIEVTGKLQTGSYEKDGQRIYTTDVVVNSSDGGKVKILARSKTEAAAVATEGGAPAESEESYDDVDVGNDDLPF